MRRMTQTVHKNEDGLVAIMVATIIMIIMTLITLGFARLMQNEQRQATDRSLSTQAFYAAESGINDAVAAIQDPVAPFTLAKSSCAQGATPFTGVVSNNVNSNYSCLRIDPTPSSLEYSPGRISTNSSTIVPLQSVGGIIVTKIKIAWDPATPDILTPVLPGGAVCSGTGVFPPASGPGAWPANRPGIMRIDLVPTNVLNRDALINSMLSVFLYPASCGGVINAAIAPSLTPYKGQVIPVNCNNSGPRLCEATFALGAGLSGTNFYLRMKSIYHNASVTVRLFDVTDKQLNIAGAQVEVDSTGKVADVVRRIQVRVPINKSYSIPEFVLQSMDSICKQIKIAPPALVSGVGSAGNTGSPGNCSL